MIREVKAEAQRVLDKARGMIRRGLLQLASGTGAIQVEGYDDEVYSRVEHWNSWGIESRPPPGADVLLVLVGGDGSQPIAIAMSHRAHRPTGLNEGDAALYGSKSGSDQAVVHARADGSIDLEVGSGEWVNVGGDSERLVLGDTLGTALLNLGTALATAASWPNVQDAGSDLVSALGVGAGNIKATKGKVT